MYKKFNQLSFVIGLFFCIVAGILFVNALLAKISVPINNYSAAAFLVFGIFMILASNRGSAED